jgi:hypothetical protein
LYKIADIIIYLLKTDQRKKTKNIQNTMSRRIGGIAFCFLQDYRGSFYTELFQIETKTPYSPLLFSHFFSNFSALRLRLPFAHHQCYRNADRQTEQKILPCNPTLQILSADASAKFHTAVQNALNFPGSLPIS